MTCDVYYMLTQGQYILYNEVRWLQLVFFFLLTDLNALHIEYFCLQFTKNWIQSVMAALYRLLALIQLVFFTSVNVGAFFCHNEYRKETGRRGINEAKAVADSLHHSTKQTGLQDGVNPSDGELDRLLQRIRSSEHLAKLREMVLQWRDSHPFVAAALSPPLSTLHTIDPDDCYNMSGLVWSKGYPIEEYEVQTADGYILGLFRIPHGRNKSNSTGARPVVFLQHGLLAASTNWVENPANESLGFILADLGYDVWMGNMRGNTYSKKHAWLSPHQKEFWEFSWDEMAKYDLPALIDFALSKSGRSRLAYVGHSQGTLIAFTGFTINPELGKKVTTLIALGPVYTVADINIGIRDLIYTGVIELLMDILIEAGLYEFLPNNFITNKLAARTICAWPETEFLCADFLMLLAGFSEHHLNKSRIQVYVSNEPAGTSLHNMKHFVQMVVSGKCQMYDYGLKENHIKYNSTSPPEYHVEDLKVPVALFWGDNDFLADPEDVANLIPRIRELVYKEEISNFEHLDFIWAMDAKSILYNDVINIIRSSMAPGL